MPRRGASAPASTHRVAVWYWKGGVGKSTTTMMLSILAAGRRQPVGWVFMDVPHQLDNIAQLGLIAADYVLFPLELTEDCLERLPTVFALIEESKVHNPHLTVLGGLPLPLAPRSTRRLKVSAKEEAIYREYETALEAHHVRMLRTVMYLSAKHSVEEARINADFHLMHWTAQRRYRRLFAEVVAAIKNAHLPSPKHHATRRSARVHSAPKAAAAA